MPDRDWQKDWELWKRVTCMPRYNGGHIEDVHDVMAALRYWLQRVRELESQVTVMREAIEYALPGAMYASCEYDNCEEADPAFHCCDWNDAVEKFRQALSTTAGEAMLKRVRELEEAVRITSAANEDLATAIQRLKEENARLKAVVEPLVMQDREMLLKKVKDLKQTDGESWAIGEVVERALAILEGGKADE